MWDTGSRRLGFHPVASVYDYFATCVLNALCGEAVFAHRRRWLRSSQVDNVFFFLLFVCLSSTCFFDTPDRKQLFPSSDNTHDMQCTRSLVFGLFLFFFPSPLGPCLTCRALRLTSWSRLRRRPYSCRSWPSLLYRLDRLNLCRRRSKTVVVHTITGAASLRGYLICAC